MIARSFDMRCDSHFRSFWVATFSSTVIIETLLTPDFIHHGFDIQKRINFKRFPILISNICYMKSPVSRDFKIWNFSNVYRYWKSSSWIVFDLKLDCNFFFSVVTCQSTSQLSLFKFKQFSYLSVNLLIN